MKLEEYCTGGKQGVYRGHTGGIQRSRREHAGRYMNLGWHCSGAVQGDTGQSMKLGRHCLGAIHGPYIGAIQGPYRTVNEAGLGVAPRRGVLLSLARGFVVGKTGTKHHSGDRNSTGCYCAVQHSTVAHSTSKTCVVQCCGMP